MRKFIESLSQWMGIDKEATATIAITILVFATGIFLEWLRKRIGNYFDNRAYRKSIKQLVLDMSMSCKKQAELIDKTIKNASLVNDKDFIAASIVIQSLPTLLQIRMEELTIKFNTLFNKKIKRKALSKLFQTILILDRIDKEVDQMMVRIGERLEKHEALYQQNLEGLRRLNDQVITDLSMKGFTSIPQNSLLGDLISTFDTWLKEGANTDIAKTHDLIVCKLLDITKKRKPEPLGYQIIDLSLAAKLAYTNIDKLETILKGTFRGYYYAHRKAYRVTSKILEII